MIKKILVPLDGTELASQILPFAINIAQRFKSKMILLQAIEEPDIHLMSAMPVNREQNTVEELIQSRTAEERFRVLGYLEQIAKPIKEQGLEIECATYIGDAGKAIIEYADQNEVDLIAFATHRQSGFKRFVFGSVTDRVLRESRVPVLMGKPR